MNMLNIVKSLGPIDARNVRRDSLLAWIVVVPIVLALLLRFAVPRLTGALWDQYQFDLTPYYPLILSYFIIMMCPVMFGMVIGFLLLDERDDGTLTALQVTPLTMTNYLAYRILVPMVLTVILMFIVFPIANLGSLDFVSTLIASLVAAPLGPLFALTLVSFAANKVQGFALMKGIGFVLLVLPILGYFVPTPWHWAFGLLPTFWPMKVYWALESGDPLYWVYVLIALVYQSTLMALLTRRFNKVIHQ